MLKQLFAGILVVALFVSAFGYVKYLQISEAIAEGAKKGPPPDTVTTAFVEKSTWPQTAQSVGSISAVEGAVLSAETLGRIVEIHFNSGDKVKKGQPLVTLDTSVEQAQLASAKAALELAEVTAKRERALRARNANAQSDVDKAEGTLRQAVAEVSRLEAEIQRKQIIAPFAGYTGIRKVNVGQTIQAGTEVVTLQAFDPLYVNFSLPQQQLSRVKLGQTVELHADSFNGQSFQGRLTSIDAVVDQATRNFSLQATLENPREVLRPGMFVDVALLFGSSDTWLTVPLSSVLHAPYGDTIYRIVHSSQEADPKGPFGIESVAVKLGPKKGDLVAILSGLEAGNEIVSSGAFKLRPQSNVFINNEVQPGNSANPTPPNK